jgi:hypothetical protein
MRYIGHTGASVKTYRPVSQSIVSIRTAHTKEPCFISLRRILLLRLEGLHRDPWFLYEKVWGSVST